MAVEQVTGARPGWFVEFDDAPSKILAHHWPDVPNYGDVTKVDWSAMPPVDIITGGSPCQDLSAAGKRAGMTEGTRSNLWVNMREAINIIRPKLVVWENVLGALSATATSDSDMEPGTGPLGDGGGGHLRALGRVAGDLAEIGYDAQWTTLRASDIGAPHHRARVFLTAAPADAEGERLSGQNQPRRCEEEVTSADSRFGSFSDTDGQRRDGRGATPEQEGQEYAPTDRHSVGIDWGPYAAAVRRWERLTRPAPAPTEPNTKGKPRLNAEFASWMMGLPEGHVTQVPGISRADQLKAVGNGVCVPQGAAALTTLLEMEDI